MREIWEQEYAPADHKKKSYVTTNMLKCLDKDLIGKPPNPMELYQIIQNKKVDLARINDVFTKKQQRAKDQLKKVKATINKNKDQIDANKDKKEKDSSTKEEEKELDE